MNKYVEYKIKELLIGIEGFGTTKYSISKSKIQDIENGSYLWEEKDIRESIKEYVESVSPLIKTIKDLIEEVNSYKPLFKYSFSFKVKGDETINGLEIWKASGRQFNRLASYKAHTKEGNTNNEPQRHALLRRLGYDTEGYDIPSTIWTTSKALVSREANAEFDLKTELVGEKFKDVNGNVISDRKMFKPLTQICFFCINSIHAYSTYISPEVRKEFEEKMGESFVWPEFDEETFKRIYYKCKNYINLTNEFIETVFFWESIWELLVIRQCYREGIAVLNVYDCFFLKDKEKYPRLKEIIKEQLEELIKLY